MVDPLAEVVALLQPSAPYSKVASGAGAWRVERTGSDQAFYCLILEGTSRLVVDGQPPIDLQAGAPRDQKRLSACGRYLLRSTNFDRSALRGARTQTSRLGCRPPPRVAGTGMTSNPQVAAIALHSIE